MFYLCAVDFDLIAAYNGATFTCYDCLRSDVAGRCLWLPFWLCWLLRHICSQWRHLYYFWPYAFWRGRNVPLPCHPGCCNCDDIFTHNDATLLFMTACVLTWHERAAAAWHLICVYCDVISAHTDVAFTIYACSCFWRGRNVPLAAILGVFIVTVVYILTNVSYLAVMSREQMLAADTVAVVGSFLYSIRSTSEVTLFNANKFRIA